MKLTETAVRAARLVAAGQAGVVRYAATRGRAGAEAQLAAGVYPEKGFDPSAPVDWLCAGKPVIAYTALRATRSARRSCDDDLRPLISAAPRCPGITLREILTYRSGLVRGDRDGHVRCVTDPPLSRPQGWDPAVDANYWNAGWELIPALVQNAADCDFEDYLTAQAFGEHLAASGAFLRRGVHDPLKIDNPDIRKVFLPDDLATSLCGPLAALCRFYRRILEELESRPGSEATDLTSSNPGPDFFRHGVSAKLRWSLGFPYLLGAQGFEFSVPSDGFGSQGAVLALTPRGLQYAWVCVAGAVPSLGFTFAVAMDKLRPVPDRRYLEVVEALMRDARQA